MQKTREYDRIQYRFKQKILNFFKGFLVGFSFVIPGLCSALVSMILNVYQDLLEVIEKCYKVSTWKKHIYFILGIISGGIVLIFSMAYLLKENQDLLTLFFLGLAIGGFTNLYQYTKPLKIVDFLLIIGGIWFSMLPELMIQHSTNEPHLVLIVIGGLLSSLAFILPGISGSLILLTLGIYPTIINVFSNLLKLSFDNDSIIILLTFLISFVVGAIVFSKIINKVFEKYEKQFLKFCLGLLIGSIVLILEEVLNIDYHWIIKIIMVVIGFMVINIFNKKGAV